MRQPITGRFPRLGPISAATSGLDQLTSTSLWMNLLGRLVDGRFLVVIDDAGHLPHQDSRCASMLVAVQGREDDDVADEPDVDDEPQPDETDADDTEEEASEEAGTEEDGCFRMADDDVPPWKR